MKLFKEGVHGAYRKTLIPLFLLLFPLIAAAQTSPEEAGTVDKISELSTGINTVWMLLAAMLVFAGGYARILHAAGIRPGRSRVHPQQKHR
ncbi:putative uncharacterized protein [Bacteroides sp. CAG:875]|nr:putative uncharacterized protein [Bacteroides sp. CAG:875]